MSAPTSIRGFEAVPLDIPLLTPFGIAGGVQPAANNVLLKVWLEDGTVGYGEAAPLPPYNGETQAGALAALLAGREWIVGRDARQWRELGVELARRSPSATGSARCAFETAVLDALTRHDGISLTKFFGGAGTELTTDMTVTTGTAEQAAADARAIRARNIRILKVKVGGPGGPARDLARLAAIHEAAPDSPLILDGNAGVDRAAAKELVRGIKALGVEPLLLEQWLPKADLEGMRDLHRESGWKVAADESVVTAEDARRIAQVGAAQVVNIKLMKAGLAVASDIVGVARAEGLGLMIGGNVESLLAMTTSACFAAGHGGFGYADLDTPLFLATNPFDGGFALDGDRISVAGIAAGHGTTPRS